MSYPIFRNAEINTYIKIATLKNLGFHENGCWVMMSFFFSFVLVLEQNGLVYASANVGLWE